MLILTIRTDNPEAEIGLFDDAHEIGYQKWQAHRQLAESIHEKISRLLGDHSLGWQSIEGIVVYQGPGSFTGLRIGLSVANSLAQGLGVPIVSGRGTKWQEKGVAQLLKGENSFVVLPFYGAPVHITAQKK
jgi:tRNA threonylcarbamoyladenosine biosynthesis protein TsaB